MALRSIGRTLRLSLFLILAAGCSGSKEDQARKLEQERASWQTTAALTRELSGRGALPDQYARQVLQKAAENLQKIRKQQSQQTQ
jgi:hypothetical protein